MQIKLRQTAFVIALIFLGALFSSIQDTVAAKKQNTQKNFSLDDDCAASALYSEGQSNCERVKQVLDLALIEAQKATDSKLVFVARLGEKEKSKTLNQRRMTFIRNYLFNTKSGAIEKEAVVFQEGKRSDGLGAIEIYLKDNSVGELAFGKNVENACKSGVD